MPVHNLDTQEIVTTTPGAPAKPGALIKPKRLFMLLVQALGFNSVTISTTAPLDQETLWYNSDTDAFRRYNPNNAAWESLVPSQYALHLLQKAFKAAQVEGVFDNADKFPFFDVSANESKMISAADFKASLGITGWLQYGATQTLVAAQTEIEFDLPAVFGSVLLHGTWQATGAGTLFPPEVIAVYPTNAEVNIGSDQVSTIEGGTSRRTRAWLEGDRSDLTGVVRFNTHRSLSGVAETLSDQGNRAPLFHLTNRVAKLRYRRTSGTWQFAIGSVFKLFVR